MAMETLRGVKEIRGTEIKLVELKQPESNFIEVNHKSSAITFKLQNGAVKENGVNGCQLDCLIEAAKIMITKLNEKFPCSENLKAINYLNCALKCLDDRKADREARNVEGFEKK